MTGDAELDEGSNWEAVQFAGRAGLGRLLVVVVDNGSSSTGWPGGIASRFVGEGWTSATVDGRDHDLLLAGYRAGDGTRPHVVVARVEQKGT